MEAGESREHEEDEEEAVIELDISEDEYHDFGVEDREDDYDDDEDMSIEVRLEAGEDDYENQSDDNSNTPGQSRGSAGGVVTSFSNNNA